MCSYIIVLSIYIFIFFLVTQITMQQTMRTLAFACESCVFAYLGLAIFSFPHKFELSLILWSIFFILIGRALNICKWSLFRNKMFMLDEMIQNLPYFWNKETQVGSFPGPIIRGKNKVARDEKRKKILLWLSYSKSMAKFEVL